jgi:respiratory burst oxidase
MSTGTSPGTESGEEFVEVTLDLQGDDTIVLRSVEPATSTVINIDDVSFTTGGSVSAGAVTPVSRSPTIRRSSSNKLLQFSQELKAEAVAKARQFSHELKAELRRFSWSHGQAARILSASGNNGGGAFESALAARALRKQRAQLDRTRSGAHKALRGLRFISKNSKKTNGVDAWSEVQSNFEKLAEDGYLNRADFAQCIGSILF